MAFWTAFISVFICDYLSKVWVRSNMALGESRQLIGDLLQITHWQNTGAAFGLFQGATVYLALVSAGCVALSVFAYPRLQSYGKLFLVALGLLSGGALGNLVDRVHFGGVTDFVSFRYFPPVFNIADSAIVIGSLGLAISLLIASKGSEGV